jgi:hypothetical protein
MRPGSREVVLRARISPDLIAHVPATPGGRPSPTYAPIARMLISLAPRYRRLII